MLIFRDGSLDGAEAMRFLISVAMHMKASSTLLAFLADVSRKGMLTDCCAEVKGRVGFGVKGQVGFGVKGQVWGGNRGFDKLLHEKLHRTETH